jgi:hypothetical protein
MPFQLEMVPLLLLGSFLANDLSTSLNSFGSGGGGGFLSIILVIFLTSSKYCKPISLGFSYSLSISIS